jgi:hypothetical protein
VQQPTYTFVSVSTAHPGRLDDLIRIASRPSEVMDEKVDGIIARQVGVDRDRNAVVVWVTFDRKETLDRYLATAEGKDDHGENDSEMSAIVASFDMYDLSPVSGRLWG